MNTFKMTKKEYAKEMVGHNMSRVFLTIALLVAPATALGYSRSLSDLVTLAVGYFNQAIYVIISLAILTFIWNIYHYFIVSDPENKKDAGLYVMYSVIGLFVIISFWGLVNIVGNTLNLNTAKGTISGFGLGGPSASVGSTNTNLNSSIFGSAGVSGGTAGTGGLQLNVSTNLNQPSNPVNSITSPTNNTNTYLNVFGGGN
jgi:phosphatidylglycerophosphatase A